MIEKGEAFIIIRADLSDPACIPQVTVSGMSMWAATNIMQMAVQEMWDRLGDTVNVAFDSLDGMGDIEVYPAGMFDDGEDEG
jgi:hypothetical protein